MLFDDLLIFGLGNGFTLLFRSGAFAVESNRFSVNGDVHSLTLIAFPAGAINQNANIQFSSDILVAILDVAGNIIDGGNSRPPFVAISAFSSSGIILATQPVSNGIARFTSLSITSPVLLGGTGMKLNFRCNISCIGSTSPYFFVSPGTECRLRFLQQQSIYQYAGQVFQPRPKLVVETRNAVSGLFEPVRGSTIQVVAVLYDSGSNNVNLSGTSILSAAAGSFSFTDLFVSKASDLDSAGYYLKFSMLPRLNAESALCKSDLVGSFFNVQIGPTTSLNIIRDIVYSINGLPFPLQPCLTLIDAGGNRVRDVAFVSASLIGDTSAMLRGSTTVASEAGVVTFTDLYIAGASQGEWCYIRFSSLSLTVTSSRFLVETGTPYAYAILVQPTDSESMIPMKTAPVVSVRDAGGSAVNGSYEITAQLIPSSELAQVNLSTQITVGDRAVTKGGIVSFPLFAVGLARSPYQLIFSWNGYDSQPSMAFNIYVGSPSALRVGIQPAASVVGVEFNPAPIVVVIDAGGNAVGISNCTIFVGLVQAVRPNKIYSTDQSAPTRLVGSLSRMTVAGRALFSSLSVSGTGQEFSLRFTSSGLSLVFSEAFNITGPPAVLNIVREPLCSESQSNAAICQVGRAFSVQPVVQVLDFNGHRVQYLDVSTGVKAEGKVSGGLQADFVKGLATFTDLNFEEAGMQSIITFSSPLYPAIRTVNSRPLDVISGMPKSLLFLSQPLSSSRGIPFGVQPAVSVLDSHQNFVSWYSGVISAQLWLGNDNVTFALSGNRQVLFNTSTGIAKYSDLSVNLQGQNYYLKFDTLGLTINSDPFVITNGPPNSLLVSVPTLGAVLSSGVKGLFYPQPILKMVDVGFGVVSSFTLSNCGGSCSVSVELTCCPLDPVTGTYSGSGQLGGNTTVIAINGIAAFTDLSISVVGVYTLRFKVPAIIGVSPSLFVDQEGVLVQIPSSLVIKIQPDKAVLGLSLRTQPVVNINDASGLLSKSSFKKVSVSIANDTSIGCTSLSGSRVITANGGIATFTDLVISNSGVNKSCRLNFTSDDSIIGIISDIFSLSYGPAQLVFVTQPSGAIVGNLMQQQPILSFQDFSGQSVTNDNGNVVTIMLLCGTTSCSSDTCGLLGNTAGINLLGVVAFTDIRIDKAAPDLCTLRFQMGRFSVISDQFLVIPGSLVTLGFLTVPVDTVVNTVMLPAVRLFASDSAGNVLTSFNGTAFAELVPHSAFGISVSGATCQIASGVASFDSLKFSSAGPFLLLRFSTLSVSSLSPRFSVHGPAYSLKLIDFPMGSIPAGEECVPRPQVAIYDVSGILASSSYSNETVTVSLFQGTKIVSFCGAAQSKTIQGFALFPGLWFQAAGINFVARFQLASNLAIFVDSLPFNVDPGLPSRLKVLQSPTFAEAGKALFPWPRVQVYDSFGNVAPTPSVYVSVDVIGTSKCTSDSFLNGLTEQASIDSMVEFRNISVVGCPDIYILRFKLKNAQNSTDSCLKNISTVFENRSCILEFAATCPSTVYSSGNISVKIGSPQLFLHRQPGPGRVGRVLSVQPVVRITDTSGNLFQGRLGEFTYFKITADLQSSGASDAVLSDANGPCPCSVRLLNGEASFTGLKVDKASSSNVISFLIDSVKIGSISSLSFPVTWGPVSLQILDSIPAEITYNSNIGIRILLLDPNRIPVGSDTVVASLEWANGTLNAYFPQRHAMAPEGLANFMDLRMNFTGRNLRFRFQAENISIRSNHFSVISGNTTSLEINPIPISPSFMSGSIISVLTVTFLDSVGNIVDHEDSFIAASLLDPNASVVQVLQPHKTLNGVAQFSDIEVDKAGRDYRIMFSAFQDRVPINSVTTAFTVTPGPIKRLVVSSQPGPGIVGQPLSIQPVVSVQDGAGNIATFFDGKVVISGDFDLQASLGGVILGHLNVAAVNGVVRFTDISIPWTATSAILIFSSNSSCGLRVASASFVVTENPISLNLTQKISPPIFGGSQFSSQPKLSVFDAQGLIVSAFTGNVSVYTCGGDGKGTISGTLTITFSGGVAYFSDLSVNLAGSYLLCFQTGTLSTSFAITVGVGPPFALQNINKFPKTSVVSARADVRGDWRNSLTVLDSGGNTYLSGQSPPCIGTELVQDNKFSSLNPRLIVKRSQLCNYSYFPLSCEPYTDPFTGDSSALVSCSRAGIPYELQYETSVTTWPYLSISSPCGDLRLKISLNPSSWFVTDAFQVISGQLMYSVVVIQPGPALCNTPWSRTPTVAARDAGGNSVTSTSTVVTLKVWNQVSYFSFSGWRDVSEYLAGCNANSTFIDGIAAFAACRLPCYNFMVCSLNSFRLRFEGIGLAAPADPNLLNFAERAWSNAFTISSAPRKLKIFDMSSLVFGGTIFNVQPKILFWADNCNPSDFSSPPCNVLAPTNASVIVSTQDQYLQSVLQGSVLTQVHYTIMIVT